MRLMGVRQPLRNVPPQIGYKTLQAPFGGLVTNENVAAQSGKPVARWMRNYYPTLIGIRPRGGTTKFATITSGAQSMFAYKGGAARKLFATDDQRIFEITNPADPDVAPAADVGSLSNGIWVTQMMETTAGFFLMCCNGFDTPLYYDGSTWTTVTFTGTSLTNSDLISVWAHGKRLWFCEKGTLNTWYLATDSIAGTATKFPLAGVFKEGGEVLFGTTMSLDTGAGMDDKWLVCTTEGEIAVYSGTDPSSGSTWALEGVYKCAKFLGRRGHYHVGGMPHFMTIEGIIPMSAVISKERAEQSLLSVSQAIDNDWVRQLKRRTAFDWQCVKWSDENMLLVTQPVGSGGSAGVKYQVSNLENGAWCEWDNWDFQTGAEIAGNCYMGDSDGYIWRIENTSQDNGSSYQASCVFAFDHLDRPGMYKTLKAMRANFQSRNSIDPILYASVDNNIDIQTFPSAIDEFATSLWDEAVWDEAIWDGGDGELAGLDTMWQSIGRGGYTHAPTIQQTLGTTGKVTDELLSVDMIYEYGGGMV